VVVVHWRKPMLRRTIAALAAVALALSLAGIALGHGAAAPTLKGTVGPGYTIKLAKAGKKVTSLKAGTYTFVVSDRSSFHNFTLEQEKGGKFEKHITSTPFTGSKTVRIKLKAGRWKYYCSIHEPTMFGFFTVK
jgi:plastocyanin